MVEGEEWNERNRGRGLKLRVEGRGDKTLYNTLTLPGEASLRSNQLAKGNGANKQPQKPRQGAHWQTGHGLSAASAGAGTWVLGRDVSGSGGGVGGTWRSCLSHFTEVSKTPPAATTRVSPILPTLFSPGLPLLAPCWESGHHQHHKLRRWLSALTVGVAALGFLAVSRIQLLASSGVSLMYGALIRCRHPRL